MPFSWVFSAALSPSSRASRSFAAASLDPVEAAPADEAATPPTSRNAQAAPTRARGIDGEGPRPVRKRVRIPSRSIGAPAKGLEDGAVRTGRTRALGWLELGAGEAQVAGDQHPLDLAGPLADLQDLGVPVVPGHRRLVHEPVPPVDLNGVAGARH